MENLAGIFGHDAHDDKDVNRVYLSEVRRVNNVERSDAKQAMIRQCKRRKRCTKRFRNLRNKYRENYS